MPKLALVISALFLLGSASACGTSGTSDADKTTTTITDATTTTGGDTTTTADEPDTTTTTEKAGGGDSDDYIAAMVDNLQSDDPASGEIQFDAEEAECVATEWIDTIGIDAFEAKGISATELSEDTFQFAALEISEDQAIDMIDAIDGCGVDAISELRAAIDAELDADQQKCLATELDDETIYTVLVDTLVLGEPGPGAMPELERVAKTCKLE